MGGHGCGQRICLQVTSNRVGLIVEGRDDHEVARTEWSLDAILVDPRTPEQLGDHGRDDLGFLV